MWGMRSGSRRGLARSIAAVAGALLASCGGSASTAQPGFAVRDVSVVVHSEEPFTHAVDFPSRVESTLEAALAYWGGDWGHLAGRSVTFEGSQTVPCGDRHGAFGCFDGDIRLSTRDPAFPFTCVEQTVLVHEVGHAVIGDAGHTDPRWMDFAAVSRRLQGRRGYAAHGDADCTLYPSVWQHPPDQGGAALASTP